MKNPIILLLLIIAITSCKKHAQKSEQLSGKWELESSNEGLSGRIISYPSGQGNILEFSQNTYSETKNSKPLRQGRYTTIRKKTMLTGNEEDFFIFDAGEALSFFSIKDDKLSISQDAYDWAGVSYHRINGPSE